jgi:rhodanese-related sulfurtransferase
VISAILKNGGTIYDLQEVEQAYAPPFSSAKDPVNIAGFAAENILNKMVNVVHWKEIFEKLNLKDQTIMLVDVRTPDEYKKGTIDNAVNIPVDDLRNRLDEIPKEKKLIVFCAVGLRGYLASRILLQKGYVNVYNLSGGYKTYQFVTQKQANEDIFENDFIGKDDDIYQANL